MSDEVTDPPASQLSETISTNTAMNYYDRLGSRHDWFEFYEGEAKKIGLAKLELSPGNWVLNAGSGTGNDHMNIVRNVRPGGLSVALDISSEMIALTKMKTESPCLRADISKLPFRHDSFDKIFSSYVLDLVPVNRIKNVFLEFHRVLRPGGKLVVVSLTEGETALGRLTMGTWKTMYRISPATCGGCRPVTLCSTVEQVGFRKVTREVVQQYGIPSEVIVAIS